MENTDKIGREQYELYDRNIRLWGLQNQNKLSNSKILLVNLNCAITELGKNLVLSGMNLYLYDKDSTGVNQIVSQKDGKSNFFLSQKDTGKERVGIIKETLQQINTLVSIKEIEDVDKVDNGYQCVVLGFSSFQILSYYEDLFRKKNIPFYCIIPCGLTGFIYVNLGTAFKYGEKTIESLTLSHQVDNYLESLSKSISHKKIQKNNLITSFCSLQLYYRNVVEGPKIDLVNLLKTYVESKVCHFLSENNHFSNILKRLVKYFNTEFNPVCSCLAGVVSQEVFKVITLSEEPDTSFYIYEADIQSGNFIDLSSVSL